MGPKISLCGSGAWPIFFHLLHFFLALFTVIGLHFTGLMWDYKLTEKVMELWAVLPETDKQRAEDNFNAPWRQWTGMMWAVIVGLVGLVALVVLIASVVMKLPKRWIRWYYLAAALLILFVACLGLFYNASTVDYPRCRKRATKSCVDERSKTMGYSVTETLGECVERKREETRCLHFPVAMHPYFLVAAVSLVHVILYGASFVEALTDKDAESSPYGKSGSVAPTDNPEQPPPPGQEQSPGQQQPPNAWNDPNKQNPPGGEKPVGPSDSKASRA